jgi:hypothetical protein
MSSLHHCPGSPLAAVMIAALLLLAPFGLSAQEPAPADSAAVLLETARDFEARGRGEVAEALYAYIVEHFGATPAASVARTALESRRAADPDGSGRVELQVWGTLYGLWLGVAVPTALGAEDTEAYGAGILLGAPAGFLAARAMTRSRSLTYGQTRAITWGGTWGTYQGLGWGEVFDVGAEEFCSDGFCYESGDRTEEQFASMIAGGLVGVVVGGILSRRDIEPGVATGAHYGSIFGTWMGLAGSSLLDVDEEDRVWATTLLAGNAGLVGGAWAADRFGLSRNRVRLIGLGALLGGLAGVGIDLLTQPDDDKVAVGIPFVLSLGGLGTAAHLTRDYDGRGGGSAPGGEQGAEALLRFNGGAWAAGIPTPQPTLVRVPDATGRERLRPGLRFTLVSGRF